LNLILVLALVVVTMLVANVPVAHADILGCGYYCGYCSDDGSGYCDACYQACCSDSAAAYCCYSPNSSGCSTGPQYDCWQYFAVACYQGF
jgi:hypothetical protein